MASYRLELADILVYPLKSARGMALHEWPVDDLGLRYDRRWMVVDVGGRYVTQRAHPAMALVSTAFDGDHLVLTAPGMPPLRLPLAQPGGTALEVVVWADRCQAVDTGPDAARWCTAYLGFPSRLVHMQPERPRAVDPAYGPDAGHTSFTDGFPFLLLSQASLDDLNGRLFDPVPMNRFRPNLVVRGGPPFSEDWWKRVRIGAIEFNVAKPCPRCSITTTDQATGERGAEPLRTLATYRRRGQEVLFGQNAIHRGTGTLRVGDEVVATYRRTV